MNNIVRALPISVLLATTVLGCASTVEEAPPPQESVGKGRAPFCIDSTFGYRDFENQPLTNSYESNGYGIDLPACHEDPFGDPSSGGGGGGGGFTPAAPSDNCSEGHGSSWDSSAAAKAAAYRDALDDAYRQCTANAPYWIKCTVTNGANADQACTTGWVTGYSCKVTTCRFPR